MSWSGVVLSSVVQAMLLGALAFLARSIILQWLGKDLEVFKASLSGSAQRTLEEFKAELSKDAREHQVRFESLHARRVDAIEAVYVKLVAARYTMEKLVTEWSAKNKDTEVQVSQEFWELRRELGKRRIYLPEALCDELQACIDVMWNPAVAAMVWPGNTNAAHIQRELEAFEKAQTAISEDGTVAIAIAGLEREFRKVLGGTG